MGGTPQIMQITLDHFWLLPTCEAVILEAALTWAEFQPRTMAGLSSIIYWRLYDVAIVSCFFDCTTTTTTTTTITTPMIMMMMMMMMGSSFVDSTWLTIDLAMASHGFCIPLEAYVREFGSI